VLHPSIHQSVAFSADRRLSLLIFSLTSPEHPALLPPTFGLAVISLLRHLYSFTRGALQSPQHGRVILAHPRLRRISSCVLARQASTAEPRGQRGTRPNFYGWGHAVLFSPTTFSCVNMFSPLIFFSFACIKRGKNCGSRVWNAKNWTKVFRFRGHPAPGPRWGLTHKPCHRLALSARPHFKTPSALYAPGLVNSSSSSSSSRAVRRTTNGKVMCPASDGHSSPWNNVLTPSPSEATSIALRTQHTRTGGRNSDTSISDSKTNASWPTHIVCGNVGSRIKY